MFIKCDTCLQMKPRQQKLKWKGIWAVVDREILTSIFKTDYCKHRIWLSAPHRPKNVTWWGCNLHSHAEGREGQGRRLCQQGKQIGCAKTSSKAASRNEPHQITYGKAVLPQALQNSNFQALGSGKWFSFSDMGCVISFSWRDGLCISWQEGKMDFF